MKVKLVWAGTCLLWGSLWLFIKIGLRDLPPVSFAGIRLTLALAILLPVAVATRTRFPRRGRDWLMIFCTGTLLLGLNYGLVFWGTRYVTSGLAALLQSSTPLFGLIFARLLLPRERVGFRRVIALALGLAGVAVIFSGQLGLRGGRGPWGCVAVLGGGASVALAYILVKAYAAHMEPTALAAGQMLCSAPLLLAAGYAIEGSPAAFRWSPAAVGALLYLALVGSVVAFWLNYWLLHRMGPTAVLLGAVVDPLVAAAVGALVLGERLTPETLAGGTCVLLSAWLALAGGSGGEGARCRTQGTSTATGGGRVD